MALSTFPPFVNFIKEGYRIGISKEIEMGLPAIYFMMPETVRKQAKKFFQGRNFLDVVVANLSVSRLNEVGFPLFVDEAVKNKIMFATQFHEVYGEGLFTAMEKQVCLVESNYICKGLKINQNNHLMLSISLRIWGYLSKRFVGLYLRWEEMGFLVKLSNMKAVERLNGLTKRVKIETTLDIKQPQKIRLWSSIGFSYLFVFVLGSILLFSLGVWIFVQSKYLFIAWLMFKVVKSKIIFCKENLKISRVWLIGKIRRLIGFDKYIH